MAIVDGRVVLLCIVLSFILMVTQGIIVVKVIESIMVVSVFSPRTFKSMTWALGVSVRRDSQTIIRMGSQSVNYSTALPPNRILILFMFLSMVQGVEATGQCSNGSSLPMVLPIAARCSSVISDWSGTSFCKPRKGNRVPTIILL